jgi:hypothetical protein
MTNAEAISLVAITATFLTTLVGWIFTYRSQQRTQREIANLQEQFSTEREKRRYKLARLDELEVWFDEGQKLSMDEMGRYFKKSIAHSDALPDTLARAYRDQCLAWTAALPRHYALAGYYDPLYEPGSEWDREKQPIPGDLAHLVIAFGIEVQEHINYLTLSTGKGFVLKDSGNLTELSIAGINAIERVRQHILGKPQKSD